MHRIEAYTAAGREAFDQSREKQDAVIFCFIVIGEAIKHLNKDLLAQEPHIDWGGFARFRDFLVHQYHNTEIEIAWRAAQEDMPALKAAVTSLLASLDDSEAES
ncbi:MAG: DUF86 domain-containing protein [Chloroflexota bacterium]|nr:DUF86 domain-containing protein [Chloroflexota bacterium]MDE2949111.1 DUF86 domain-containing protein [Chloroflexota bacterium]